MLHVHMLTLRNPQIDGFPLRFNIEVTVYQPALYVKIVKDLWLLRKGYDLMNCSFRNLRRVPLSESPV